MCKSTASSSGQCIKSYCAICHRLPTRRDGESISDISRNHLFVEFAHFYTAEEEIAPRLVHTHEGAGWRLLERSLSHCEHGWLRPALVSIIARTVWKMTSNKYVVALHIEHCPSTISQHVNLASDEILCSDEVILKWGICLDI